MRSINQGRRCALFCLFFLLTLMVSCAPMPYLNVNYRLPAVADGLGGKKVSVTFEDGRADKEILGRGARESLKDFSGNLSLSVARGMESGFKIGVYDLGALFKEVFKRRLENGGVTVLPAGGDGTEIRIVLKEFLLDLVGRNWTVRMGYEARLLKAGKLLSRQGVSGEAERLKLIGQRQADEVLSEIFTDMVNRLDLVSLFRQGGS